MIAPVFLGLTLLDIVALLAVLRPPRSWVVKLALILGVLAFNFTVFDARGSGTGWPAPGAPDDGARFISCDVIEPALDGSNPGAIYLWVMPTKHKGAVFGYRPSGSEPRSYALPYTRQLHEECEGAKKASASGDSVGVRAPRGRHGQRTAVHFYHLPPPHFQTKEVHP
jgi:hypothetical protein